MRMIVSDVTFMRTEVCVAGWCSDEHRMVRPLSSVGRHWSTSLGSPELFWMGNVVELTPAGIANTRGLPHKREDLIVRGRPALVETTSGDEIANALAESESSSLAGLFEGHLKENRFVRAGADCPSLGAVRVAKKSVRFAEDTWDGRPKLRCGFRDSASQLFRLPVVSARLRGIWRDGGLKGLNEFVGSQGDAHVRIGLAHPMDDGRAFAMVNDIAFY